MKKTKEPKDYTNIIVPCVVAIDPAKVSGYAIWNAKGLNEYGIIKEGDDKRPFEETENGLLLIEEQYIDRKKGNFRTPKLIAQRKERFKIRAEDQGYRVIEIYPKTWQTAIGIPPFKGWKRDAVKVASKRYAEHIIGESIDKGLQDAADAICIGQTFINAWRVKIDG